MMFGLLAFAAVAAAQQAPPRVEDLTWLEGYWRTLTMVQDRRLEWSEEHWSAPAGGTMLGIARTVRGSITSSFEFMRIAREEGRITFFGSPNGARPVRFALVRSGPNQVVFENAAHDYPQRISYRRDGHKLVATVSLSDGTRPHSFTYYRNGQLVP